MLLFFSLIAAGLISAGYSGGALTWDGSKHLFDLLHNQAVTVQTSGALLAPRYSAQLLQLPALWASRATDDLTALRSVFALTYATIPMLALTASWALLRAGDRRLFVWPALSIGLVTLPAQMFFVSEGLMATQIVWPIFLIVLTRLPEGGFLWLPFISLVLFLFCLHPVGSPLLAMVAAVAVVVAQFPGAPASRMRLSAVALAIAAATQFLLFHDDPSFRGAALHRFPVWALRGSPLASAVCAWLAGLAVLGARWPGRRSPRIASGLRWCACGLVIAGGAGLTLWARDPGQWAGALELRDWLAPLSLPLFGMAALDEYLTARRRYRHSEESEAHAMASGDLAIVRTVGVMFLLVLVTQGTAWFNVTSRLEHALREARETCVARSKIPWLGATPLYHGATPPLAILLQGRRPKKLLLDEEACADLSHGIHLADGFHLPDLSGGWFDLRTPAQAIMAERP